MHNAIIDNYNKLVQHNDTVYFLGDLAFYDNPIFYLNKMHGHKIYIKGNHDVRHPFKYAPDVCIVFRGGKTIQMTHDPKHLAQGYDINLCGHVHEKWTTQQMLMTQTKALNVGVDVWKFKPVALDWIIKHWDKI